MARASAAGFSKSWTASRNYPRNPIDDFVAEVGVEFIQTDWQVYDPGGRRKYLTAAERKRFLAAADRLEPEYRALCYVLAYPGSRISEALSLAAHQLDSDAGTLTFRTLKSRRPAFRTVPIPAFVVDMLLALSRHPKSRFWQMHRVTA